jgi:hypothetical protein
MLAKVNNSFVKIDIQLSLTFVTIINNPVTIDMTHVAMSNNIILDFSHIKHATWSPCHVALYYFLIRTYMPRWIKLGSMLCLI